MKDMWKTNNPHNDDKVIDACSLFGAMDVTGRLFSGAGVIKAISNMHDRSNGLGGGFAVYGLYPAHADFYALHVMYLSATAKRDADAFLKENFRVAFDEEVPTKPTEGIVNPPLVWRYFVKVGNNKPAEMADDDFVVARVMQVNTTINNAFVFSSGKNMGVFKGVGYPEQIASYFCLDRYLGYLWTTHGRFPTNTPGWWGGAHPFDILDWTVVHNGEISSYGINRRCLEQFGYQCTMQTDTEVVAYAVDLLVRRHGLPVEMVAKIFAPPFWTTLRAIATDRKSFCSPCARSMEVCCSMVPSLSLSHTLAR